MPYCICCKYLTGNLVWHVLKIGMLLFLNGEAFEDCVFFLLKQLIMPLHSHRFAEVTLKKMLVFVCLIEIEIKKFFLWKLLMIMLVCSTLYVILYSFLFRLGTFRMKRWKVGLWRLCVFQCGLHLSHLVYIPNNVKYIMLKLSLNLLRASCFKFLCR